MFNKVGKAILLMSALTAVGVGAYKFVLNDRARMSLQHAGTSVKEGYHKINQAMEDRKGIEIEEENLPNRIETKERWERLGY